MLSSPWIIHEAEVALYPAWSDGLPFSGPGALRGTAEPVFHATASLAVAESRHPGAPSGYSWTGNPPMADVEWEIAISFPDGVFVDEVSRILSRIATGGQHCLVARYSDAVSGEWSCFRWFFVTLIADDAAASGEVVARSLRLKSTWLQESVGSAAVMPSMAPLVTGEVDWICGPRRVTCLSYDPETEQWTSLPGNDLGDGTRYVNIGPVTDSLTDIAISAYLPRVVAGDQAPPSLPVASICWQNTVLARIGSDASDYHHGLVLLGGVTLQAIGIPEPLLALPQHRLLEEPVIVFRYLRRVYASLGHGVFAVPALSQTAPPFSHDLPFRLGITSDTNPATGQTGLTLLPEGAFLDGAAIGGDPAAVFEGMALTMDAEVDSRLAGKSAATALSLFSNTTRNWSSSTFVPNAGLWCADLLSQLTSLVHSYVDGGWFQGYGLVPLSRRHALSCGHNGPSGKSNHLVRYVRDTGEVFETHLAQWINDDVDNAARVSDAQVTEVCDYSVYRFADELPEWVTIPPVFPWTAPLAAALVAAPLVCVSQGSPDAMYSNNPHAWTPNNRKVYVSSVSSSDESSLRHPFYHSTTIGDSGTPALRLYKARLYLDFLISGGGPVAYRLEYINSMMARSDVVARALNPADGNEGYFVAVAQLPLI